MKYLILFLFCFVTIFSNAQSAETEKSYWMDKYLSVSLPLRNIKVNSYFGMRRDPINGRYKMHSGVDLEAHYEEVYAMFDGIVWAAGHDGANGNYIVLKHGNYTVTYCHLSYIAVRRRDIVMAGDVVGVSGNTGHSTGPHLHVSCKRNGVPVDPLLLVDYVKETQQIAYASLKDINTIEDDDIDIKTRQDFFDAFADNAIMEQKKYGIPASVTLAQMALESGWGKSNLAKNARNFFGIRATDDWLKSGKPYYLLMENGLARPYCMYDSPQESIEAHSRVLMGKQYWRCWAYGDKDWHAWLVNIKKAGYATASNYVQRCENIIRRNKLYLYDYQG